MDTRRRTTFLDIVRHERDWLESVTVPDLISQVSEYRAAMRLADPCGYCNGTGLRDDPEIGGPCDVCQGAGHGRRFFVARALDSTDATCAPDDPDNIPF